MTENNSQLDAPTSETQPPHKALRESGLIGRFVDRIGIIFALGFLLSMSVLVFEIISRYLFDRPTLWAHETTTFLCAIGFIFGGLYCVSRDNHIRVVPIYDNVSPKVKRWLDILIYLTCAISTSFFSYAAWLVTKRAIFDPSGNLRLETSGSAWNPPAPAILKVFLLIILLVMTAQFITFAISHLRRNPDEL